MASWRHILHILLGVIRPLGTKNIIYLWFSCLIILKSYYFKHKFVTSDKAYISLASRGSGKTRKVVIDFVYS
jgi:hypothetical protein